MMSEWVTRVEFVPSQTMNNQQKNDPKKRRLQSPKSPPIQNMMTTTFKLAVLSSSKLLIHHTGTPFFLPTKVIRTTNITSMSTAAKKTSKDDFATTTTTTTTTEKDGTKEDPLLPTMIVFDLDDCLWSPEMHELPGMPSIPVEGDLGVGKQGIVGLKVPRSSCTVSLFDGARRTLKELATNPKYRGIILATASSSLEPSYSYKCLQTIEILPGVTMEDMFQYNQIGRTGRLTSRKTSHFSNLHEESGVPFEEMLFFDDCNWGDHCATVTRAFGVVSYRTPSGLDFKGFLAALQKYREEAEKRQS